jgi:NADP-dependent 3-hydroxy acid dehydrogenase YdfG
MKTRLAGAGACSPSEEIDLESTLAASNGLFLRLGPALCEHLRGARVVCAARSVSALAHLKKNDPDSAIVLPLDVLHPGAIGLRWTRPCRGRADAHVLVNDAGYGLGGRSRRGR